MAFSASDAAFEGFRIIQREPKSVLAWIAFQIVVGLLVVLPFVLVLLWLGLDRVAPGTAPSGALLSGIILCGLILAPLMLLMVSVMTCAVYRCVLRPDDQGLFRMRLGGDEVRVALLWLILSLFAVGVYVAAVLVFVFLGVAFGAGSQGGGSATGVLVLVLMGLAFLGAFIWVAVRLSLAAPMTFAQGKLQVFGSWKLTKGRFWPLLGCYVLAFVFCLVGYVVSLMIQGMVSLASGGGLLALLSPGHGAAAGPGLALGIVVGVLLNLLIGGVIFAVSTAPAAAAYRGIAGVARRQLATFD